MRHSTCLAGLAGGSGRVDLKHDEAEDGDEYQPERRQGHVPAGLSDAMGSEDVACVRMGAYRDPESRSVSKPSPARQWADPKWFPDDVAAPGV